MTEVEKREQEIVLARLRRHGAILAETFRLGLRSIDAERPQVKRRYGICYDDGSIRIRLRSVRNGELLKYSSMVDTLCHELAHLKHFDHGRRFWALYERILAYSRRRGIYRPGPERQISVSVIGPERRPAPPRAAPPPQAYAPPPQGTLPGAFAMHASPKADRARDTRRRPAAAAVRPEEAGQLDLF